MATTSLYQCLGEREAIAWVVRGLYCRLTSGSDSWYHWKGRTRAQRETELRSFTHLVCAAAGGGGGGGAVVCEGLVAGLDIKNVQWRTFVDLAAETLDEAGLGDKQKEQFFSVLTRAKEETGGNHDLPPYNDIRCISPFTHSARKRSAYTCCLGQEQF